MLEDKTLVKDIKKYLRSFIREEHREIKRREAMLNVSKYSLGFSHGALEIAEETLQYIKEKEDFYKLKTGGKL